MQKRCGPLRTKCWDRNRKQRRRLRYPTSKTRRSDSTSRLQRRGRRQECRVRRRWDCPSTDCHEGLGQPWQDPLTTPAVDGVPLAHWLGPPPPATVVITSE